MLSGFSAVHGRHDVEYAIPRMYVFFLMQKCSQSLFYLLPLSFLFKCFPQLQFRGWQLAIETCAIGDVGGNNWQCLWVFVTVFHKFSELGAVRVLCCPWQTGLKFSELGGS